jgi:hypothetical protein
MAGSDVVVLRAPRWQRVLTLVVDLIVAASGLVFLSLAWIPGASVGFVIGIGGAFVVLGVLLAARALRVSVTLTDDTLRSVGNVVTTTIPRAGITVVLDDATVEWRTATGAERRTALWVFRPSSADDHSLFAAAWRWRWDGLMRVREWAHARAV